MSILPKRIAHVAEFISTHGLAAAVAESTERIVDAAWDRRLGITTGGMLWKTSLDVTRPDSVDYVPIRYRAVLSALKQLPGDLSQDVFVDFGCGKGRAVAVAARLRFKRVVGVELSPMLAAEAMRNLSGMRGRAARSVEILCGDAAEIAIPPDATVLYFFNPFDGDTLKRVTANLAESIRLHPRRVTILYFNDDCFEKLVADQPWISKAHARRGFHGCSFGIYTVGPTCHGGSLVPLNFPGARAVVGPPSPVRSTPSRRRSGRSPAPPG